MSSKLQFIPVPGTRVIRVRSSRESRKSPWEYMSDIESVRAWLDHNSPDNDDASKINWRAVSGFVLSLVASGACWAGIGFAVERLLK